MHFPQSFLPEHLIVEQHPRFTINFVVVSVSGVVTRAAAIDRTSSESNFEWCDVTRLADEPSTTVNPRPSTQIRARASRWQLKRIRPILTTADKRRRRGRCACRGSCESVTNAENLLMTTRLARRCSREEQKRPSSLVPPAPLGFLIT